METIKRFGKFALAPSRRARTTFFGGANIPGRTSDLQSAAWLAIRSRSRTLLFLKATKFNNSCRVTGDIVRQAKR